VTQVVKNSKHGILQAVFAGISPPASLETGFAALLEMTLTALLQTIFFSWDRCEHHQVKKPVAIPPPQGNTIPSRFAELYFRTFNHNLASPQ
jgi:hypothetical protein